MESGSNLERSIVLTEAQLEAIAKIEEAANHLASGYSHLDDLRSTNYRKQISDNLRLLGLDPEDPLYYVEYRKYARAYQIIRSSERY